MLLVYTHKITPRLRYSFNHFFKNVLGVEVEFTTKLGVFIAQSGPKFSYTNTPLGNEFFVHSNSLLFEQGIQEIDIEMSKWDDLPAFFGCNNSSMIPFDVFAASFYLISRYEEYLVHVKDENGRFMSRNSLAVQHDFIDMPLIDLWAKKVMALLVDKFPELSSEGNKMAKSIPLVEVVSPYKYIHKSLLRNLVQFFMSLSKFELWNIVEQFFVLLGVWKDPWDNFNAFFKLFKQTDLKPRFFFLYSKITYYDQGISVFNAAYNSLIKSVADYHKVSLLVSTEAKQKAEQFKKELESFESVIHRNTKFIQFNLGVTSVFETYRNVLVLEEAEDFSLGYHDQFGYRASTAVPFNFYDLSNEIETSLILYSLVASEEVLRTMSAFDAFAKLKQLKDQIPTSTGVHVFSVTNSILCDHNKNSAWREAYSNYILIHDKKE
jgi:hypothetical protein